jgi:signal transduction histidine kinase
MRWGVLANLAVILAVSGILLFLVFSASLERAAIDVKIQQADILAGLVDQLIRNAETQEKLWTQINAICLGPTGVKLVLYDARGKVIGGCGPKIDLDKPKVDKEGRRITTTGPPWPTGLLNGRSVIMDLTGSFPHGIGVVRGILEISPSAFLPAWKFFGAYLILTQSALFFLGYLLFHRTIIGPVSEIARLAGKASGIADFSGPSESMRWKGDIQQISSSLKGMLLKIMEDRKKMNNLIEQLQATNRDLEAAQQGLIRSEKLAGVGRLAAGLAHEVGNPLQIVMGYAELLKQRADSDSLDEILPRMDQELRRIHDILQRLLEFARPIRKDIVSCDVNALLKDCVSAISVREGFQNIEFEYQLDPELEPVRTEPDKMRQILVNLIFNSADAMSDPPGKIILRTRKAEKGVEIEVEDNGAGIPEEHLEKVFDPFFTTKEPGKGTGLGLAVCLGLVESLGGSIQIRAAEGHGTVVTVRQPQGVTA